MDRGRRFWSSLVFALCVLGWLGGSFIADVEAANAGLPMPREIRIGFQVIPNSAAVVKAMGWWERLGVPVRWYQFEAGRDVNTALASGSIDIGLVGTAPAAAGISQGIPYEIIWIYNGIGDNEALVVRKGLGIDSAQDLVGRTVAVTFGSTTHYHLLKYLEDEGVEVSRVRILDMQPPEMLAAWLRGDIDAGWSWHPNLQHMIDNGGEVLYSSRQMAEERGIFTGDASAVRIDFARQYPHVVAAYLALQHEAVILYRENPETAISAVAREFAIDKEVAAQIMAELIWLDGADQLSQQYLGMPGHPGLLAENLRSTSLFLKEQGTILRSPELSVFQERVNPEYLVQAMGSISDE